MECTWLRMHRCVADKQRTADELVTLVSLVIHKLTKGFFECSIVLLLLAIR